jgi:transcriptional regulator with XRE-family HTH domain
VDQGRDWAARCAAAIGWCVANWRRERKLSAQQLADRCAGLGMPSLSRVVITKLENQRREAVSTAELAVLARALDVPPVLLLFPLGHVDAVEVLPGLEVDPYTAIEWFSGEITEPADGPVKQVDVRSPLLMWGEHAGENQMIKDLLDEAQAADADEARLIKGRIETVAAALQRVRRMIRDDGMVPPDLYPETARIIGEEAPDGSR